MNSITDSFLRAGQAMSQRLGIHFPDLLMVMNRESAIDPATRNPSSGAAGLIQIIDLNRVGWRGSREEFLSLSAEEQLPYVETYLRPYAKFGLDSIYRLHQALFVPATLSEGSGRDQVLIRAGGTKFGGSEAAIYNSHRVLDVGNKGFITAGDLETIDRRDAAPVSSAYNQALARLQVLSPSIALPVLLLTASAGALGYWWWTSRK